MDLSLLTNQIPTENQKEKELKNNKLSLTKKLTDKNLRKERKRREERPINKT